MNTTQDMPKPVNQNTACINEKKIIVLSIERDDEGTRIKLKSPIDWRIMKSNRKFNLGGVPCFAPNDVRTEGIDSVFSTEPRYEIDGMPNLSLLLADNIKQGVTFNFPPYPIAHSKLLAWANQFKEDAKILFLTYVKPVSFSVEITSATIEKEIHD